MAVTGVRRPFFIHLLNPTSVGLLSLIRPKKKICLFKVTDQKKLGTVGRRIFLFYLFFYSIPQYSPTNFSYIFGLHFLLPEMYMYIQ